MSITYTKGDLVYWFIGSKRVNGEVIDVFSRVNPVASKFAANENSNIKVLLVQLDDNRKVLKLADEVKPDKRGFV